MDAPAPVLGLPDWQSLITFPLVFGWIHFASAPDDQMTYVTYLFGFPVGSFPIRTVMSWLLFHGLDISAVLVLAGIALALWRRMRDRGALTLQDFGMDFLPLIMLFAISVTGLALTASTMWLRGSFYGFLAILHAITVIGALLYLPFGKFFHIFQRPAQIGVKLYQDAGERGRRDAIAHAAASDSHRRCRSTTCDGFCRNWDSTTAWTVRPVTGRAYARRANAQRSRPRN